MVLGLRSKKQPSSVPLNFVIHIHEIKPWPPSQSLKSLRSVSIQWENNDRSTGHTAAVIPGQNKIDFNESFKISTTLVKDRSSRSGAFKKNALELSLYEPRRDRTAKGPILGTAVIDLAEHGTGKEEVSFGVPLSCKRSYRNTAQPVVYVTVRVVDKSMDRESVSALMSEEYAEEGEETEIASFTDDDVSSHSSLASSALAHEVSGDSSRSGQTENASYEVGTEVKNVQTNKQIEHVSTEAVAEPQEAVPIRVGTNLPQSLPAELSTEDNIADNVDTSLPSQSVTTIGFKKLDTPATDDLTSAAARDGADKETRNGIAIEEVERSVLQWEDKEKLASFRNDEAVVEVPASDTQITELESPNVVNNSEPEKKNSDSTSQETLVASENPALGEDTHENSTEGNISDARGHSTKIDSADSSHDEGTISSNESLEHAPVSQQHKHLLVDTVKEQNYDSTVSSQRVLGRKGSRTLASERLKNMQSSLRSPSQPLGSIRYGGRNQDIEDVKEIDVMDDVTDSGTKSDSSTVKNVIRSKQNDLSNDKMKELEIRVEMLEEELRQAAAIEMSLYSIVAEHGSSVHKVHTPARRLSRIYIHASTKGSPERRGSTARSIVSGLISASKACGNDVPRLAFWLSNSVVLRGIVSQVIGNAHLHNSADSAENGNKGKFSLKWEASTLKKKQISTSEDFVDLKDPYVFTSVLEKIEAWIFSRIIESIWWQTLTPHMQSMYEASEPKTVSPMKNKFAKQSSIGDQLKANLPIEIWKKAFDDACGRLCPVRAEGHECGCLPVLSRLVMEQCVARLDVAMFNAILRESDDDIPTDPVSDPISDPKVLPVSPGNLSFGAGAQLKNAIGNWSRWLTDLFGMDEDDSPRGINNELDDKRCNIVESFKPFLLLNAMSDLLMLPKDMLLENSIRKEVCPTFSASIIRRILTSFSPDEFCPDPIPDELLEALDSEDPLESEEAGVKDFPCDASPVTYHAPSPDLIRNVIGDVRKTSLQRIGSSIIRKCHTSDDELDELDSPLSSIFIEKSTPKPNAKKSMSTNAVRYQLLRDVWRSDE